VKSGPLPAWFSSPPPIVPCSSVIRLGNVVEPPPPIAAPKAPAETELPATPPIRLGEVAFGSSRSAVQLLTLNSSGSSSVVPRKSNPAVVPALPASAQYGPLVVEEQPHALEPSDRGRSPLAHPCGS
jgi:hypothetical protein